MRAGARAAMQTFGQYVRGVLGEVVSARDELASLGDRPGDLEAIRREAARILGLLGSLAARLEAEGREADTYRRLQRGCRRYADSYYFDREISTMAPLYAGDPGRLRSMRLKVLESLDDGGLMGAISESMAELEGA